MNDRFKYTRFIALAFWLFILIDFIIYLVDFSSNPNEYILYNRFAHLALGYVNAGVVILWSILGIIFSCLPQQIAKPLVKTHLVIAVLFSVGRKLMAWIWWSSHFSFDYIFNV